MLGTTAVFYIVFHCTTGEVTDVYLIYFSGIYFSSFNYYGCSVVVSALVSTSHYYSPVV